MGKVKSIASRMLHGYFINRKTGYVVYVESKQVTQTILAFLTNTAYFWVDHISMVKKASPAIEENISFYLCLVNEATTSWLVNLKSKAKE